jgi:hypothetical protein
LEEGMIIPLNVPAVVVPSDAVERPTLGYSMTSNCVTLT